MKNATYSNPKITYLALLVILLSGLILRLVGTDWDQGYYLNPDERFLVMTAETLEKPANFWQYFNPQTSLLNPYNKGVDFFVYGHFPLNLAKLLATIFNLDSYSQFYKVARPLTGLADFSVILAIFLISSCIFAQQKNSRQISLLAAFSYVLMVFPLQQAHFFTTDSFVNAFLFWSLFFMLKAKQKLRFLLLSAIFFGLGQASKITAVYFLPLLLAILVFNKFKSWRALGMSLGLLALVSYLTLRLADPYLFASTSFFNPLPNPLFLDNLKQLNQFGKEIFFPPGVQWLNTGWGFPLKNILLYSLGPGLSLITLIGILTFFWPGKINLSKKTKIILGIILVWLVAFFAIQASQFAKTMRYFIFLYPLLALFCGLGASRLKKMWRGLLFLPAFLWLVAFCHLFTVPHTRVSASLWLNTHLPKNSRIVWEYWDDPLPLYQLPENNFKLVKGDFYENDSPKKWQTLAETIANSDYLVLSSNRLWASITKVPESYPMTSRYYQLLLNNQLGFKKIKEFNSFPTLELGLAKITINDASAEEAFTVYDHPQVMIFKNEGASQQKLLKLLNAKKQGR